MTWQPEYPNPAFDNMRPDDAFWAARIVARFTHAIDPRRRREGALQRPARDRLHHRQLIKRRDKVLRTWLTGVNPIVDVALSDSGELTFANAAEKAGVASPAQAYVVQWSRFDN